MPRESSGVQPSSDMKGWPSGCAKTQNCICNSWNGILYQSQGAFVKSFCSMPVPVRSLSIIFFSDFQRTWCWSCIQQNTLGNIRILTRGNFVVPIWLFYLGNQEFLAKTTGCIFGFFSKISRKLPPNIVSTSNLHPEQSNIPLGGYSITPTGLIAIPLFLNFYFNYFDKLLKNL